MEKQQKGSEVIQALVIDFSNLNNEQQIKLLLNLMEFAHETLPDDVNLNVFIKTSKGEVSDS